MILVDSQEKQQYESLSRTCVYGHGRAGEVKGKADTVGKHRVAAAYEYKIEYKNKLT